MKNTGEQRKTAAAAIATILLLGSVLFRITLANQPLVIASVLLGICLHMLFSSMDRALRARRGDPT
jgi:hypothetical protein